MLNIIDMYVNGELGGEPLESSEEEATTLSEQDKELLGHLMVGIEKAKSHLCVTPDPPAPGEEVEPEGGLKGLGLGFRV